MEERIRKLFHCVCIVVAKERRQDGEKIHHHIAVLNENASKIRLSQKSGKPWRSGKGGNVMSPFIKPGKASVRTSSNKTKHPMFGASLRSTRSSRKQKPTEITRALERSPQKLGKKKINESMLN
ncbi:hypothetical protein E5676_scaffold455G003310 [Cucumis melo var. makuwa]|uniref:Uncharacterized protein n=1 Tax=Cucumis melo var. makuwa TaxID=1194695 RepID=A0A5D3E5J3_CUCMM|nr:hypothetical protein E6C27_scaffold285G00980 [Cucumis melo var. makuwa]TYK31068.1 hypothetical protein E5676_scaffold455G003310 [Cucumis melo var. makuwa]